MGEVPKIDLAWEAVSALGAESPQEGFADAISKALTIIEQLGGKDPGPQRLHEAMFAELQRLYEKHGEQSTADVLALVSPKCESRAASPAVHAERPAPANDSAPATDIAALVRAYREGPAYRAVAHKPSRTIDNNAAAGGNSGSSDSIRKCRRLRRAKSRNKA
jgi:hypothetical protein